jgi:SNF2 family DNA or RNA helicase
MFLLLPTLASLLKAGVRIGFGEHKYCDTCVPIVARAKELGLHSWDTQTAKIIEMAKILKDCITRGDKTIVYSQWTSMLNIVESVLRKENMKWVRCKLLFSNFLCFRILGPVQMMVT